MIGRVWTRLVGMVGEGDGRERRRRWDGGGGMVGGEGRRGSAASLAAVVDVGTPCESNFMTCAREPHSQCVHCVIQTIRKRKWKRNGADGGGVEQIRRSGADGGGMEQMEEEWS